MLLTPMTLVTGDPCLRLFLKYLPSPFSLLTASFLMLVQNRSTSQLYFSIILLPCVRKIYYQLIFFRFQCLRHPVCQLWPILEQQRLQPAAAVRPPPKGSVSAVGSSACSVHSPEQVGLNALTRQPCQTAKTENAQENKTYQRFGTYSYINVRII